MSGSSKTIVASVNGPWFGRMRWRMTSVGLSPTVPSSSTTAVNATGTAAGNGLAGVTSSMRSAWPRKRRDGVSPSRRGARYG